MKNLVARINLTAFALVMIAVMPVSGQSAEDRVSSETSAFASELAKAPSAREWFAAHGGQVRKEHAEAAEKMARSAWDARNEGEAYPYSAFAMFAFQYLGDRERSLENRLDERDESFAVADTPERYKFIRATVLDSANAAASLGRDDLVFKFMILAADCSFFSSTAKPGFEADEPLFNALRDETVALLLVKPDSKRYWFERLVSLTGATVHLTQRFSYFGDEEKKINALYKQISAAADQAILPDFAYTLSQWGDQRKTIHTAWALAVLSYQFGNSTIAAKRLTVAAQRAKEMPDLEEWLSIINLQYTEGRDAGVPAAQLRPIRDEARNAAGDLRAQYVSRAGRIWVGHLADKLYGDLLRDQLAESGELTAAGFSFAESLKARTLLDVLHSPPVAGAESHDVSALEQRALGLSTAPAEGSKGGKPAADDIGASEYKLMSHLSFFYEDMLSILEEEPSPREKAIFELESAYKKTGEGFHAVAAPASLSEIQRALQPREALLEYVIPYHRSHPAFDLYILVVTPTSAKSVHVVLNEVLPFMDAMIGTSLIGKEATEYSQLSHAVVQTRIAIQNGDEKAAQGSLRDLYKLLIQPLTDQGVRLSDFDHLVIAPHGPLHYVPFAALMDGEGKYLIRKTALTVVPSASVWLALTRRSGSVQRFVGFGNPDLQSPSAVDLKYAAQEMVDIPKILSSTSSTAFVGPDATADRFEQEAPLANVLHVSTHGDFPDEDAIDLHAIRLAPGKSGDGKVRAARVRKLNLSSTRLVALSVCNGGLYRMGPADEPYGLVPAFLEAGSQNVLGTLWKLDDQFGMEFMEEFYKHVMQDGPAQAFRETCEHFLNKNEDLRNWAAFVLVGPGRPFATQRN